MLTLVKEIVNSSKIAYFYFPEGNEERGRITYNIATKEFEIEKASNDEFKRYAFHGIRRIKEFIEKNQFEENDLVAWN